MITSVITSSTIIITKESFWMWQQWQMSQCTQGQRQRVEEKTYISIKKSLVTVTWFYKKNIYVKEHKSAHACRYLHMHVCVRASTPCPWSPCACVIAAWFTVSQLCAETTGHPERKPQPPKLCFPATCKQTLSQRVTWLDPHIGSERGSPSSILSSIPVSAVRFTWSHP